MFKLSVLLFLIVASTACSTTPGDAAHWAGQFDSAAKLYKRGAEQGDAGAALKLGLAVDKGRVEGYGKAADWFSKACELGNPVGCHNTGVAYEYGKHGYSIDYIESGRYYGLAAENGYVSSQYNLGSLYANDHLSNDIEGLKWLVISQRSAQACNKEALYQWILEDPPKHASRLKKRMSSMDVQAAESKAAAWASK